METDRAKAIAFLKRITNADAAPALTDDDIDLALDQARVVDAAGNPPTDPDWTPTWNVAYAAAVLFELKATLAASTDTGGLQSFTSEGSSFTRRDGTTADGWLALARQWRIRATGNGTGITVIEMTDPTPGPWPRSSFNLDTSRADRQ